MRDKNRLLELALKGLEADRARIDDEIAEIRSQLNGQTTTVTNGGAESPTPIPKSRRRMSAAARKRISEGMKRRYAQMRKPAQVQQIKQAQGGLTVAGRKRLSEMMKARWAAKRKAAKKAA
jgi:hypothetical protein